MPVQPPSQLTYIPPSWGCAWMRSGFALSICLCKHLAEMGRVACDWLLDRI